MQRRETLSEAFSGVDRALLISSSDLEMVTTQSAFIDAARKAGIHHIVKLSGLKASLTSPFMFNRMHAEIELHLERSGVAWTHLRPSQFMTEYLREMPTIAYQNALFLPLEDVKLAPVAIDDIAKAASAGLTRVGHFTEGGSNGAAILEKPVSDRGTLEDLSQSAKSCSLRVRKLLILNGEMSEWSIEHAWKAKRAIDIKPLRSTVTHTRFAALTLANDHLMCVRKLDVLRGFEPDVSQSYHN